MTTICCIYIHPNENITNHQISQLINQLPPPFLLLGDFNGKHTLWGNTTENAIGRMIEQAVIATDACILNTGDHTHLHVQTGSTSAIDLSICSSNLVDSVTWRVLDDLYGSDHYPIIIETIDEEQIVREPRYNINKANWKMFKTHSICHFSADNNDISIDQMVDQYNDLITSAANRSIPKTSNICVGKRVPWWTDDCSRVNYERKVALRRYQHSKLLADKISYNRARARAQYVKDQARKTSWQEYVSTLNKDTPMSQIWTGKENERKI